VGREAYHEMSASSQCHHPDLHFDLHHQGFHDTNIHYLEIKARCTVCGVPMKFRGCPLGVTPAHPTMALDGSEIRVPFTGENEEYDGKSIGFVGKQVA